MSVRPRIERLGLPLDIVEQHPARLLKAKTGTHHYTHRWDSRKANCGKPADALTLVFATWVDVSTSLCKSCTKGRSNDNWPVASVCHVIDQYKRLLNLDVETTTLALRAQKSLLDAGEFARLRNIAQAVSADAAFVSRLVNSYSTLNDEAVEAVRILGRDAQDALDSYAGNGDLLEEICRLASLEAAQADFAADVAPPRWLGITGAEIASFWFSCRKDGEEPNATTLLAYHSKQAAEQRWGKYHGASMHSIDRIPSSETVFSGADFASPLDWAAAEYNAAWDRYVVAGFARLDVLAAGWLQRRDEVVLVHSEYGDGESRDPRSPLSRALSTGRVVASNLDGSFLRRAIRLPEVVAKPLVANPIRHSAPPWCGAGDLDDELLAVGIGLWTPASGSTFRTFDDALDAARAVLA